MYNAPQRAAIKLTPEEARVVERLRAYRTDRPRHMRECLQVINKQGIVTPLVLNEPQMLIHAKLEAQKAQFGMVRALILKSRKQGSSTYVGARFYTRTRLWKHQRAAVMAHVQDSSDELFKMVKTFHEHDPLRLTAKNDSAKELVFANGSSYSVGTAGGTGEGGRGATPQLGHMSEVAFYKNAEKNFAAFAGSIPTEPGTEIVGESTANGLGNEFHRRWSLAEAGLNDGSDSLSYIPIFIPWYLSAEYSMAVSSNFSLMSDPEGEGLPSERDIAEMYGLTLEQMAWRRYMIINGFAGSVPTFMQEYPCTATEAFQSTGLDLFIKPIFVVRARKRQEIPAIGPKILGVDPAGMGGDLFSMTLRQGHRVHWHRGRPRVAPGEEQVELVADVMMTEGVDRCNIDYSGGWGTALLAGMRERYPRLAEKCFPIDFNGKSQAKMVNPHKPGPRNRRAEMYMRGREWFQNPEGCCIPDEDLLQSDLGAICAKITGQSTDTLLEPKQDVKARLGRSPDVSDSWALTFAVPDNSVATSLTSEPISGNSRFASGQAAPAPAPFNAQGVDRSYDAFSTGRASSYGFDSGGSWI